MSLDAKVEISALQKQAAAWEREGRYNTFWGYGYIALGGALIAVAYFHPVKDILNLIYFAGGAAMIGGGIRKYITATLASTKKSELENRIELLKLEAGQ